MKRLAYASLAALLLVTSVTLSADPSNRPTGVTAENWVPVTDRLGIVLVPPPAASGDPVVIPQTALLLPLKPPAGGYFMVKGANGWVRLVVIEPAKGPANAG